MGSYREKLLAAGRREGGGATAQGTLHVLVPAESVEEGVLVDSSWVSIRGLQDKRTLGASILE